MNYLAIVLKAFRRMAERRSKYLCAIYLSGKDAKATKNGVIKLLRGMNVKTITLDNGKEFAYHEDMSKKLRSEIYFAHPYASYERGLSEYTNRLLRQYFPKGVNLRKATKREPKICVERNKQSTAKEFKLEECKRLSSRTKWRRPLGGNK